MTEFLNQLPENIVQLALRCQTHVHKRFHVELDFTSDTLSLLDHFVETIVAEENQGDVPSPGDASRMKVVHLFAPTIAAYFSAMLINTFGGRIRYTEKELDKWQHEFDSFFLMFNPVAVTAAIIAKKEVDGLSNEFRSSPRLLPLLQERFAAAPAVNDDEFFSFDTYFDTIQIAKEFLSEVSTKDGPIDCSEVGYDLIFS